MGSNVFLAKVDPDDFEVTVRSTVDLDEHPDRPAALSDAATARFWRVETGSSSQDHYEKMESGDLVLFYADGEYVGVGRVGTPFEDDEEWASSTHWDGGEYTHLYTVIDFTPVEVEKAAVNRIFGYSDGYTPQSLLRVADDRVTRRPEAIELALERYSEKHG